MRLTHMMESEAEAGNNSHRSKTNLEWCKAEADRINQKDGGISAEVKEYRVAGVELCSISVTGDKVQEEVVQ